MGHGRNWCGSEKGKGKELELELERKREQEKEKGQKGNGKAEVMREEKCGWPLNPHCTTLVIQVAQISLSKTRGP
jgi:hypothetical protein